MYCAYITTLKNLRKHNNADRLQCCEIFGSNVIIDLSYKEGDKVIYFPVDGQLSEEFATENNLLRKKDEAGNNIGGYLDPDKRNVRALKLRGEKSDGLVLPVAVLAKYVDVATLNNGDKITVLDGKEICRKYIPRVRQMAPTTSKGKKTKVAKVEATTYPFFYEHKDTEQLAYNEAAFKPNDTIYLTQKLHGTSFRVGNCLAVTTKKGNPILKKLFHMKDKTMSDYQVVSGTRRVVLKDFDGGFYGNNDFRRKYHDFFKDKLPDGMTVYGEIVGWVNETTPIMPKCNNAKVKDKEFTKMYGKETVFTYGCEPGENKAYIYRITVATPQGEVIELPTEETQKWCERLGCEYVPLLEKFLYTTWEDLNDRCAKYLDVPEPLSHGTHVTEGVVVRIDNRSTFTAYKTKSFTFKVIEGIIKDEADAPDMEEAEELVM